MTHSQRESIIIFVDTQKQILQLIENDHVVVEYPVSTARNGLGEQINSEKTPRGWHQIRAKIGDNQPLNTVFKGRRPTGEIYSPELGQHSPTRDWTLTRILWLSGLELGYNRLGNVDTMRRYIYIHGTPDDISLDKPLSHGCVRMHNQAIIDLYDRVPVGTKVFIGDKIRELS
jgi:lipoprotein-anchoring transpeptidase ErfK/SrfK